MCEILVRAIDTSHSDPAIERRFLQQGYPVLVKKDGHSWGNKEGLPNFWIIKFPGTPTSAVAPYTIADIDYPSNPDPGDELIPTMYRSRLYRFQLAPNIINQLNRDGEITINAVFFNQAITEIPRDA